MAWPKGVPRNPKPPVIESIRYDAIFGVRSHRSGVWKGKNLWELAELNNGGSVKKILIDATDRRSIMNYIAHMISKIVVFS